MKSESPQYRYGLLFDIVIAIGPWVGAIAIAWCFGTVFQSAALGFMLTFVLCLPVVTERVEVWLFHALKEYWPTKPG